MADIDWMTISPDGFWRPRIRAQFTGAENYRGLNTNSFVAAPGRLLETARIEYAVYRVA